MAYEKLSLNAEDLNVTSFTPDESVYMAAVQQEQAEAIGGDSVAPYCIVYISDCVSCF